VSLSIAAPDTVVLIHGLWMSPRSWERWASRFERRGLEVLAPAWPGMEGGVAELRSASSSIDQLGIAEILDAYELTIRALERPPVIMGHSFGGAFAEMLLDRGLGASGVAIDAAGVRGITKLSFGSGQPVPTAANRHRAVSLSFEEFRYSFADTLCEAEAADAYERYAVPAPGRVLWEAALANFGPRAPLRLDFGKPDRAPLLMIDGEEDHVVPAVVDKAAARRFERSDAVTVFKEFPGRAHCMIGRDGWEEVADFALEWALEHAVAAAAIAAA